MTDTSQAEFSSTDDEADKKVRNDGLIDALLEYTLLDIRTPEIMESISRQFLDGIFFISTHAPVQRSMFKIFSTETLCPAVFSGPSAAGKPLPSPQGWVHGVS
ncbi:MAG: hypothetical protein KTR20_10455 [Cellvibrionaceae bacterium]|nr:hypothetical protein [Cellvibrionaceae bacterium]